MNNEQINSALDLINVIHSLFLHPTNREEEEVLHLINAVRWRVQNIHAEYSEYGHGHIHG